jgi:toxin ParE1/3/4
MTDRYRVVISGDAEADLRSIFHYIAENGSLQIADAWLAEILERIGSLEQFPHRGSTPPELTELGLHHYRQLSFRPYRIFYSVADDFVMIALIADGRRNMESLLQQRLLFPNTQP